MGARGLELLVHMPPSIMVIMSGMMPAITEAGIFTPKRILVGGMRRLARLPAVLPLLPHSLHRVLLLRVAAGGLERVRRQPRDRTGMRFEFGPNSVFPNSRRIRGRKSFRPEITIDQILKSPLPRFLNAPVVAKRAYCHTREKLRQK